MLNPSESEKVEFISVSLQFSERRLFLKIDGVKETQKATF